LKNKEKNLGLLRFLVKKNSKDVRKIRVNTAFWIFVFVVFFDFFAS